jgi:predicted RNA-binding Zn ribbon-like protein
MAEYTFDFSGGNLCLDFANTVSNRATAEPIEHLQRYEDWLAWWRQAAHGDTKNLERLARRHPGRAQTTLERVLALRETLYSIFSAIAASHAPPPQALAALNRALPGAMARPKIVAGPSGYALQWHAGEEALDAPLGPIVRSAAELLSSVELAKVRECAAEECAWLFLDTSRNKQRRWCDMKVCGNRNKARRYYRKQREA